MVIGINKFRDHFAGYEDQYALVGGAACDLIFTDAGLPFRSTRDLDIVLCVEVMDKSFACAFQGFLEAGGYKARQKSDGRKEFYRFLEPADGAYPEMIELFSRQPGGFVLPDERSITRVPVDERILSLSAILLDDACYNALQNYRIVKEEISLLNEEMLIPFKAKAFPNLTQRKSDGEDVRSEDIKKHRNDVFRLARLLRRWPRLLGGGHFTDASCNWSIRSLAIQFFKNPVSGSCFLYPDQGLPVGEPAQSLPQTGALPGMIMT